MTNRRIPIVCMVVLALAPTLGAQRGRYAPGTGNPDEHLVPWKFLPKGADLVKAPVVVYWLPASLAEVEHSPLRTSQALLDASARCIGLEIVTPDDAATIDKLGTAGKQPMALIIGADGRLIRQVNNTRGVLRPQSVEQMLRDELSVRDDAIFRQLTEAEREKSVDLYKKIWDDRCLYPLLGAEAQKALKGLGVIVTDTPAPPPPDPNLKVTSPTKKKGG